MPEAHSGHLSREREIQLAELRAQAVEHAVAYALAVLKHAENNQSPAVMNTLRTMFVNNAAEFINQQPEIVSLPADTSTSKPSRLNYAAHERTYSIDPIEAARQRVKEARQAEPTLFEEHDLSPLSWVEQLENHTGDSDVRTISA